MTESSARRVILLGTGTGVGKSFVAAALARGLRKRLPASKVIALKPVETGRVAGSSSFADAAILEQVSSSPPPKPHPLYGLGDPISPHLAAEREHARIEIPNIVAWVRASEQFALQYTTLHYSRSRSPEMAELGAGNVEAASTASSETDDSLADGAHGLAVRSSPDAGARRERGSEDGRGRTEPHDNTLNAAVSRAQHDIAPTHDSPETLWSLIETAGGVFTPLSLTQSNLDLARALDPAIWLLVAPDALGVLHDLTATLIAMSERARRPDAVVLTAARGVDASTGTNARELARLGIVDVAAVLPPDDGDRIDPVIDWLCGPTGRWPRA